MRIGILTFHFGNNYGGILQCYALQKYLKKIGHDVEIINYKPSNNVAFISRLIRKLKTINSLSVFINVLINAVSAKKIQGNNSEILLHKKNILTVFDDFRKDWLCLSDLVNEDTIGNLSQKYDAIIVGSDQVWTSLYDKKAIYFLEWAPLYHGKRIAYAACSAHSFATKKRSVLLREYFKRFDLITVRDQTTQQLVEQISNIKPEIVADPTLLHNFSEFITSNIVSPYILTYILGSEIRGGHDQALMKIKEKYGSLPVKSIIIPGFNNNVAKYSDEQYYDISPQEWIDMFNKATFVYTDSFHGVMFAIKFNKPFIAYYADVIRSSRLIDLKKRLELMNIITDTSEILLKHESNNDIFKNIIEESTNKLADILK